MSKPKYDSSVARIAGNIAPGMCRGLNKYWPWNVTDVEIGYIAKASVAIARAIIAEVHRTEPAPTEDAP